MVAAAGRQLVPWDSQLSYNTGPWATLSILVPKPNRNPLILFRGTSLAGTRHSGEGWRTHPEDRRVASNTLPTSERLQSQRFPNSRTQGPGVVAMLGLQRKPGPDRCSRPSSATQTLNEFDVLRLNDTLSQAKQNKIKWMERWLRG